MVKIKNNKIDIDTWCGMEIQPSEYYELQSVELFMWQNNSKVLADIGSGDLIINDGSVDITDISKAINLLLEKDISPRDSDGTILSRTKVTTTGWSYQLHGVEFETSQLDSIYSQKYNNTPHGFATIKCFKDNGSGGTVQCSDQADADANAIVTQIDWEPTHDYEIMGGMLKQAAIPNENLRLWVVAAPDVPEAYGGSKVFITNVNLKFIGIEEGVKVDGRAPKYLTYNPVYHSNKLRLFFRHEAGYKHPMHMVFEFFKA